MAKVPVIIGMLAAAGVLSGCVPATEISTPPPYTQLAAGPSPTPILCTSNPVGLNLQLDVLGDGHLRIGGRGFIPDEEIFVSIKGEAKSSSGSTPGEGMEGKLTVGVDGSFSWEARFQPMRTPATWSSAVVHSRGVACAKAIWE